MTRLPPGFSEFLRSLSDHRVEYLLIGGFAVGYHGHVRGTADIDVWVRMDSQNAERIVMALDAFGFGVSELGPKLFLKKDSLVRMGVPPFRIELMTTVSGVTFEECWPDAWKATGTGCRSPSSGWPASRETSKPADALKTSRT